MLRLFRWIPSSGPWAFAVLVIQRSNSPHGWVGEFSYWHGARQARCVPLSAPCWSATINSLFCCCLPAGHGDSVLACCLLLHVSCRCLVSYDAQGTCLLCRDICRCVNCFLLYSSLPCCSTASVHELCLSTGANAIHADKLESVVSFVFVSGKSAFRVI